MSDSALLSRFESLGDNCEFGFVQRRAAIDPGGLLRWAIASPEVLIAGLASQFDDLYAFDNLVPFAPKMVEDRGTGLKFHSAMTSTNREFDFDETKRREIHPIEYEKIIYLRTKLLDQLRSGGVTFVYKKNAGVEDEVVNRMARAIHQFGSSRLLYVTADPDKSGTAKVVSDELALGYVDRFAPYATANDISYDSWISMLTSYDQAAS